MVIGFFGKESGTGVEAEVSFAFGLVGSVAVIAEIRKDRPDVSVETDRGGQWGVGCLGRGRDRQRHKNGEYQVQPKAEMSHRDSSSAPRGRVEHVLIRNGSYTIADRPLTVRQRPGEETFRTGYKKPTCVHMFTDVYMCLLTMLWHFNLKTWAGP